VKKLKTKYEVLRMAAAIVDGIPEERFTFNLSSWSAFVDGSRCGTLHCAGGWLAVHPAMNALGLFSVVDGVPRLMRSERVVTAGFEALAEVLGIDIHDAQALFVARFSSPYDTFIFEASRCYVSDKELFRRRVQRFLREQGEELENPR